jgi:hypothetical protein
MSGRSTRQCRDFVTPDPLLKDCRLSLYKDVEITNMLKNLQGFSLQEAATAYNKNIPDDLERSSSGRSS